MALKGTAAARMLILQGCVWMFAALLTRPLQLLSGRLAVKANVLISTR